MTNSLEGQQNVLGMKEVKCFQMESNRTKDLSQMVAILTLSWQKGQGMKIDQTNHESFPKLKHTPTSLTQMWESESQHMTFCSFLSSFWSFCWFLS
jgi:hypothetical protein